MPRLHQLLVPLLVGATAIAGVGCAGTTTTYVVEEVPSAREEVVIYRPGHIWIQGHWTRASQGRWVWRGGYYERERPSYLYVQGHWERRGRNYVWVDGGWRPRGRVVVRGHLSGLR